MHFNRFFLLSILICGLTSLAATPAAGQTSIDFNPAWVGRVENASPVKLSGGEQGLGRGMGVIVSPCYMLTNFHAVYGHISLSEIEMGRHYIINYYFGTSDSGNNFRWITTGRPAVFGGEDAYEDWALVRLTNCPGMRVSWPSLDSRDIRKSNQYRLKLAVIEPLQNTGNISFRFCNSRHISNYKDIRFMPLFFNCRIYPGLSGASLFSNEGNLVGITVGLDKDAPIAAPIFEIVANRRFRSAIEADKYRFFRDYLHQTQIPDVFAGFEGTDALSRRRQLPMAP